MSETTVRMGVTEHWAVQTAALGVTLRHLHCTNGPARTLADGSTEWWRHGQLHRAGDLPTVERADGRCEWWQSGWLHREVGPAITTPGGAQSRHLCWSGQRITAARYNLVELSHCSEWWQWGERRREGGPAVEYANGNAEWWVDSQHHCERGPAVAYSILEWLRWDQPHRIDGAAVVFTDKYPERKPEWWIYGRWLTQCAHHCVCLTVRRAMRRWHARHHALCRTALAAHLPSTLSALIVH